MRTPDELQAELEKRGLGAFAALIFEHRQACVRFSLEKAGEYDLFSHEVDDQTAVGSSKLGGYPDVPSGFVWPTGEDAVTREGVALPFLAQVRLADIARFDEGKALPQTGLLSFFFDFMYLSEQGWHVFYFEDETARLERRPAPSNIVAYNVLAHHVPGVESPYHLHFRGGDSIPDATALEIEAPFQRIATENGITRQSDLYALMDAYNALCFEGEAFPSHQLLGHEAIDYGRATAASWWMGLQNEALVGQDAAEEDISKWRLLFQVDNDHRAGLEIGSGNGVIAFYIREEDLKRADFSNVFGTYLK